jgi:hypothetical protein
VLIILEVRYRTVSNVTNSKLNGTGPRGFRAKAKTLEFRGFDPRAKTEEERRTKHDGKTSS